MQKRTYYVRLTVDASVEQIVDAARRGSLLSSEQFDSIGRPSGNVVGVFVDRETGCQFDLVVTADEDPLSLTAGVVCPVSSS